MHNLPLVKLVQWSLGRKNHLHGGFFISNPSLLDNTLRTIVYIDGFNLYFGAVKRIPYRWLDLSKLALRICKEQNPNVEISAIKYFTADIKALLSQRGSASWEAQQAYLTSLKSHIQHLQIIKGALPPS